MMTTDSAFTVYAAAASFVALHMMALDGYAGLVRGKTKTAVNEEDARTVSRGAQLVEADPPAVARVMRAHRNLVASALPFLIVGLIWVLLGTTQSWALGVFGVFVGARILHSVAYLGHLQPWRTLAFVVGQGATIVMLVQIVRTLVA